MDEADYGNERMEKWLEAQISEHQYQLSQMGDIEAETCTGCSYSTKSAWGRKCDGWKDCRDDIERKERFASGRFR